MCCGGCTLVAGAPQLDTSSTARLSIGFLCFVLVANREMPFLWLKFGQVVDSFVLKSNGNFKVEGSASVGQAFSLDASTIKINGAMVPYAANGWTEATVTELGFPATSQDAPLLVTGEPRASSAALLSARIQAWFCLHASICESLILFACMVHAVKHA